MTLYKPSFVANQWFVDFSTSRGSDMTEALEIAVKAVQLYAETHPRPIHVSQKQAAEMLGLSAPTVGRMVKSGQLRLNGAGLIPVGQIDELLATRNAA